MGKIYVYVPFTKIERYAGEILQWEIFSNNPQLPPNSICDVLTISTASTQTWRAKNIGTISFVAFSGMWQFLEWLKLYNNLILSYYYFIYLFAVNMFRFFIFKLFYDFSYQKLLYTIFVRIKKKIHIFHECKLFWIWQTALCNNGQIQFVINSLFAGQVW